MATVEGWVAWTADVASILSLVVSLYVAWQVRGIKRRFVRRFAVAAFIKQLRAHKVALTGFIEASSSDKTRSLDELARCEANLRWAAPHLERGPKRDAQELLQLFDQRSADLEAIYGGMIRLLQRLENAATERKAKAHVE